MEYSQYKKQALNKLDISFKNRAFVVITGLIIFVSFFIQINSSIMPDTTKDFNITDKVQGAFFITENRFVHWNAVNFVTVYNFPSMSINQTYNMTITALGTAIPAEIKVSPDQKTLVAISGLIICWIDFNNNIRNCDSNNIIKLKSAKSFEFLQSNLLVVIGKTGVSNYSIANLGQTNISKRLLVQYTLPDQFLVMNHFGSAGKVIGGLKNRQVYQMLLVPGPNYHIFVPTGIIASGGIKNIIGTKYNGDQIIILGVASLYQAHYRSNLSQIIISINYGPFQDIMEVQGTIIFSQGNDCLHQLSKTNITVISNFSVVGIQKDPQLVVQPYVQTNGSIYIYAYKKALGSPTLMSCYKILNGTCTAFDPYCNVCDATICYSCLNGLTASQNSSCISNNCLPQQQFNLTTLTCQCTYRRIFNTSTSICECAYSFVFNINNGCQCPHGFLQNTNTSICDPIVCSIGYQIDSVQNFCVPVNCNDKNCILCSSSNLCINCSLSFILTSQSTCLFVCLIQNCLKCSTLNVSKCLVCKNTSFALNLNGQCQFSNIQDTVTVVKQVMVYPLSVPNIKSLLKSSSFVFFFLDQYWFYIYHNITYRQQVKFVFSIVKDANEASLVPQFVNWSFINDAISPDLFMISDYTAFTPWNIFEIDDDNIQFLRRAHDMYTYKFILSILIFFCAKILVKIVRQGCTIHSPTLKSVYEFLYELSLLKTLFISLFQASIIFISFNCTLQLFEPGYFRVMDKMSMMVSHLIFFVIIVESLCFYLMIYALQSKKQAQIYLHYSKYCLKGFINESILTTTRSFVNGVIHAVLINNYKFQISFLISVKIIIFFLLIKLRYQFNHKIIFLIMQLYIGLGFLLDLVFVFDYILEAFTIQQIGLIQAISLAILFALTCLLFIAVLLVTIGTFVKNNYFNNVIQPQEKLSKKNNNQRTRKFNLNKSKTKIQQQVSQKKQNINKQRHFNRKNVRFVIEKQNQNVSQLQSIKASTDLNKKALNKKYQKQEQNQQQQQQRASQQQSSQSSSTSSEENQSQSSEVKDSQQNNQQQQNQQQINIQNQHKRQYRMILKSNGQVSIEKKHSNLSSKANSNQILKSRKQTNNTYSNFNKNLNQKINNRYQQKLDTIQCMRWILDQNGKRKLQLYKVNLNSSQDYHQEQSSAYSQQKQQQNSQNNSYINYKKDRKRNISKPQPQQNKKKKQNTFQNKHSYTENKNVNLNPNMRLSGNSSINKDKRKHLKQDIQSKHKKNNLSINFNKSYKNNNSINDYQNNDN